jgi:hypothetical protein
MMPIFTSYILKLENLDMKKYLLLLTTCSISVITIMSLLYVVFEELFNISKEFTFMIDVDESLILENPLTD